MILRVLQDSSRKWLFAANQLRNAKPNYGCRYGQVQVVSCDNLVNTPIHYQEPKELIKTILKGGNYRLQNRNFWLRCASAVIYHSDHFTVTELAVIANAFGKVKHHDQALFKAIACRVLQCESSWQPGELPTLLDAFRACSVFDARLFERALATILANLHVIGADGLALTLQSLTVTTGFTPDAPTVDTLVSPLFTSISQFSLENIETIVRALARLKYRNVALLQLIADHVKRRSDQPRACYALLKALIDLKYVDRNVAQMASDFVCATAPFMHVNEIPELLGVLLAIHTQLPIDSSIYQAVTRVVSRNQEHADWKVVFGVKAALETVNMRDTYLDEMCKRLSVQCCTDLSTESKIELLRSCKNYPLPLVCLYDAVLSSFQKAGSGKEHAVCILAAPVNTKAFMDLISVFSDLGYVKGLCACLATIGLNATSIEGELAIKYQELLMRHFDYQDLLLAYEKTNAEVEYVEKLRARTEPAQSDASMKAEAESSADRLAIRPIQAASSAMTKHFERYLSGETLATLMDSWKRLDHICTNASPLECALGICRATSTKYVCRLVSRIIGAPCDALEPEIIPAVLRRTLTISQVEGRTPETIIKLHAHLLGLLTHRPSIQNLSMKACTSLISVLESIEHPCVEKVLPLMVECYVDRMNSSEDIMDVRRCCNESISLMGICIKRKAVDARRLAACICLHARHVELDRVQQLLSLLVELGFVKNKYTNLLEPLVEKAITLDSDMSRVLQLEEYGKHLGFVFTQEIKNEV